MNGGEDKSGHTVRAAAQRQTETYRLFSNNEFFHFLDLGHMVFISLELSLANPLIYPYEHLSGDVLPIIHSFKRMRGKEREKEKD